MREALVADKIITEKMLLKKEEDNNRENLCFFWRKKKKRSYNSFFFSTLSSLFSSQSRSYDGLALGLSMVWVISEQSGLKFRFGFWFRFLRFRLLLHTGKFSVFFDDSSVFRCIILLSRSSWFICVVLWAFFFFFSKSFASPNNYLSERQM